MTKDDRALFAQQRDESIQSLYTDENLFKQSKNLLLDLDKYRYPYIWTWLGLPIIQLPVDVMVTQEIIWQVKPTVIIETGVARGGSLLFSASMLQLLGYGKVLGIDIDIRDHNRQSIESSPFAHRIKLFQSDSTSEDVIKFINSEISKDDRILVMLDSNHSYEHVKKELALYSEFVTLNSFLIVSDTLLGYLSRDETPKRADMWYPGNEPLSAVKDFLKNDDRFRLPANINGKLLLSSSPNGYLERFR